MKDIATWYVSLYGIESEIQELRAFLSSANCSIIKKKIPHEGYFLTACRFSNLADVQEVCESSKRLVTMIRAFAKIERKGNFESINVGDGRVTVDGKDIITITRLRY